MEKAHMDEFIKLLDSALDYIEHELLDDTIIIRVASNIKKFLWYVGANLPHIKGASDDLYS